MVWPIKAVTDWPRARNEIASPAATATWAIAATLRRFWRSALRTPMRTLSGTLGADRGPPRATSRSSWPPPYPLVPWSARVCATGLRSARRSAGSDAATASTGPSTRLATTIAAEIPKPKDTSTNFSAKYRASRSARPMPMIVPATAAAAPSSAAVRSMIAPICRRRPPSVLRIAISRACSAMSVFIVAAMRNSADRKARIVMMYSSAITWPNADCPGHWPAARVAGSAVIGSVPVCAVRYARTSLITRDWAAGVSSVSRNPR